MVDGPVAGRPTSRRPPRRGGERSDGSVPSSVSSAGVLMVVSGGLTLLTGLLSFTVATLGIGDSLLGLLALGIGGLEVYLGLQLQELADGARTGAILAGAASIVVSLVVVTRGGGSAVLGVVLPAVAIYLLYRLDSRAAFPSRRPFGL